MDTNNPEGIGNDEPLSMDEAIKAYASNPSNEIREDQPDDEDDVADDEAELSDDEEEDGEQPEEDQAEDETEEGRFVAKNGKVRLPDGSVSTIEDLINGNLRNADYTRKTQEAAEVRKQAEEYRAVLSQYEAQLANARDVTVKLLETRMPQPPDEAMLETDFVGYVMAKAQYDRSLNEYQQYQHILAQQRQYEEQVRAHELNEVRSREQSLMLEKIPELRDREKAPKMMDTLVRTAEKYGMSQDEIMSVMDHRLLVALRDLSRLQSVQGEGKEKVRAKVANKPPVSTGSKRVHPAERRGREADTAMQRLNQTGSLRDGVLAYLATQKRGK